MNTPDTQLVFHGSKDMQEIAVPRPHVRGKKDAQGTLHVTFDAISFHATPYKWIALAYTYNPKECDFEGKRITHNMGVNLIAYEEVLDIYGCESLEKSLEQLYGDGGYVMTFRKEDFFHTTGLGAHEVITQKSLEPLSIERVDDPVAELKKMGIRFNFIDLAKTE